MQKTFIENLRKILDKGETKALLISATGTGKTFASAFAMHELGFKRILFVVHRSQLANQAMKSYEEIFDSSVKMGIVGSGNTNTIAILFLLWLKLYTEINTYLNIKKMILVVLF